MTEDYYHIITDLWRLFRCFLAAPDAFSQTWWQRWVDETNKFKDRPQYEFTKNLACTFTAELERLRQAKHGEEEKA